MDDKVKKDVKKQLESLRDDIKLTVFTQKIECRYCENNRKLEAMLIEKIKEAIK